MRNESSSSRGQYERLQAQSPAVLAHRSWILPERVVVLRIEDGLARGDERCQRLALVVLMALLVDGEVEVVDQIYDLVQVVLQADGKVALVGLGGKEAVEGKLVRRRQIEAGVVGEAVDVVGLTPSQFRSRASSSRSVTSARRASWGTSSHRSSGKSVRGRPIASAGIARSSRNVSQVSAAK
jgi:hypothetical protein